MSHNTPAYRSVPVLATVALLTLCTGCISPGVLNVTSAPKKAPKKVAVQASAYSSGVPCNGAWAHRNAIGGRLKSGDVNSAAADWSRFPVGTKFKVVETGKVYVVDDYGSAMVGKDKVDLYMGDYRQVRRWGLRDVTLEIVEWGCAEKSLAILKPRSRSPHVRRMVEDLEDRLGNAG